MADTSDLRIEQANAAIHQLFREAPNGCIPAEQLPRYDELLNVWLAAVKARDEAQRWNQEPAAGTIAA